MGNEIDLIADIAVEGVPTMSYSFEEKTLSFPLIGSPNKRIINEINIKKITQSDSSNFHTLQLARETPGFLKKQYGFTHENGYIVIERNTFLQKPVEVNFSVSYSPFLSLDTESDKKNVLEMLSEYRFDALHVLQASPNETNTVLSKAELITQFLWNLYDFTGPSDKIESSMGTYQILQSIQSDRGSVQCAGTRDLFISIAEISKSGLDIRMVDASRYYPFIDNVVVNGHSILEIKTEKGWFLFDPFVRVFFRNMQGNELVSAADLKNSLESKSLDQIEPFHVTTKHARRNDFDNNEYANISKLFIEFQHHLYEERAA
ncbi:MAG: hypothetical protein O2887_18050 [Bacteroidetes bacterium]|nr:hypothetical protein [Bacteroidota bacterium]MDA1122359.1 hypothetical protein [Bacteroidota bacterium]